MGPESRMGTSGFSSGVLQGATLVLMGVSAFSVEVAAQDGRWQALPLVGAIAGIIASGVVLGLMPRPADPQRTPPVWVFLLLAGLTLLPMGLEPWRRRWTQEGFALELQMVFGLRNLGLGLAACSRWAVCLKLSAIVSLFLMLFSAAMSDHWVLQALLAVYTAVGSVWLMLADWSDLESRPRVASEPVVMSVQPLRMRVPWRGLLVLGLALLATAGVGVWGGRRPSAVLGEWLPTSGGSGETDPYARQGVGDGPEETAGENAQAAGMVDTDRMIEDNNNALIDAISELYGEPRKPSQELERMVAGGWVEITPHHGALPENLRPSRPFALQRHSPPHRRKPESSRAARGVFEVEGRTPLHIRVMVYERYDEQTHQWLEGRKPWNRLLEAESGDWMRLSHFSEADWYQQDEQHQVKTAQMPSALVPTPSLLTRFRIHRVDRPDYYDWAFDGVLALSGRRRTPPGVVIHTQCRTVAPARLPPRAFGTADLAASMMPRLLDVPPGVRTQVAPLAKAWARGEPRGWKQIDAIISRLRRDYILDRDAVAPSTSSSPLEWFLHESHRGPDYLFASSAALLLRTLGYPTRVCLGYYASPSAYDRETDHTPVTLEDLHFWSEVRLRDGHWLVLEPTPGYEVLGPSWPVMERLGQVLAQGWRWLKANWLGCLALGAFGAGAWIRRREIQDDFSVRLWLGFPSRCPRRQVRRALAILERRGRWARSPRPRWQTASAWLKAVEKSFASDHSQPALGPFLWLVEWAAYAPESDNRLASREVTAICHPVLRLWTLRQWRGRCGPFRLTDAEAKVAKGRVCERTWQAEASAPQAATPAINPL